MSDLNKTGISDLERENAELAEFERLLEQTIAQLRAELDETRAWEAFHPRAIKLLRKRKNFIVIADDEPYFIKAYMMISNHEHSKGTWTEEDEERFRAAFIKRSDEKIAEMFGDVSHPEEPK